MGRKESTGMFLDKFDKYNKICIQCHDNPDADSIASGYGIYAYFKERGKEVHLTYSGVSEISKPALQLMTEQLEIPVEYVQEMPDCDILITVDCQYKGGNIREFPVKRVAMIDHHPCCVPVDEWCCIREEYGSCCTVVWELLAEAGFDVNADWRLATALYYGLYADTGHLAEIYHIVDRRMRDSLQINRAVFDCMVNSNITRRELQIAGEALSDYYYNEEHHFAVLGTEPCDPNLLGVISDLAIQAHQIDLCVVYCEIPIGYKFSIRSNMNEPYASQLAVYVSEGLGSGGGHVNKAGGIILNKRMEETHPDDDFESLIREKILTFKERVAKG